jgi:hypothetical protein
MWYGRSALEAQLAVTRLARQQQKMKQGDLYDNLHDEIKQQAEAEKKKQLQQAEENPVEETMDDTAEDEAMDTEANDETTDTEDAAIDDTDDDPQSQDADNDTVDEAKDDDPPPHRAKEDKTDKDAKVSETDDTGEEEKEAVATESHRLSFALEFFSSGMHETVSEESYLKNRSKVQSQDVLLIPVAGTPGKGKGPGGEKWRIDVAGVRAGVVYINVIDDTLIGQHASIQIHLNIESQGRGIGRLGYLKASQLSQHSTIYAHMRKSNIASRRAAEAAGFVDATPPGYAQLILVRRKTAEDMIVSKESYQTALALEFFTHPTEDTVQQLLALEDRFVPHLITGVNDGIYLEDYAPGLAKLGFKYGGLLLKHVYKGIVVTLDAIVRGLYHGSTLLIRSIQTSIQSYENQLKALEDLNTAAKALGELTETGDGASTEQYTQQSVINQLKIGTDVNVHAALDTALQFSTDYIGNVNKAVKDHLYTTQRLIDSVVDQKLNMRAEQLMRGHLEIPGFVTEVVDGYDPPNEHCDSYVYRDTLPGDMRFIAFLPGKSLADRDAVMASYQHVKVFFGVAHQDINTVEHLPYLDQAGIERYIGQLQALCQIGLKQRQVGADIVKQRGMLKQSLLRYMTYLVSAQHKVSIQESLAEYVALRTRSLDKTYLSGLLLVQDYQRRLIGAGIRYVEASIKAVKNAAPATTNDTTAS